MKITHLLFADDSLPFMHAIATEVTTVSTILQRYEGLYGQKVNLHKFEIMFSAHIPSNLAQHLFSMLGFQVVFSSDLYLGLP